MPLFNLDFYRFSQRYSPRTLLFYTFQLTQAKIKGSMRATSRLLQSCRITFFTRQNCGLCVQARSVLADVWDKRQFAAKEIDIIKPESKGWRDLYEFDVPVIHISKAQSPEEDPKLSSKAIKLMHRFTPEEVLAKMDAVERS